jgi:beta-phosphoglucomutase-like phosphatase (HAD superfamily)
MKAILFDHDDTLVVSEEVVLKASCSLVNELLQRRGLTYQYTLHTLKKRFIGMAFTHMMRTLSADHEFVLTADELRQLADEELNRVVSLLEAEAEPSPGAAEMLAQVLQWGIICAVVSSSELRRLRVCLERTGLSQYIPAANVFSGTDSLPLPESKPSPAVYIHALRQLGIRAEDCIAVEDSSTGVLAAVRAGIAVVGYVGAEAPAKQAERSEKLIDAGAITTFSDWPSFLTWAGPQVFGAG